MRMIAIVDNKTKNSVINKPNGWDVFPKREKRRPYFAELYNQQLPSEKRLYIFDIDGTLVDWKTREVLPNVRQWFDQNRHKYRVAFATNQGGVGLRYWMEMSGFGDPSKYPTESEANRMCYEAVYNAAGIDNPIIKFSFSYLSKKGKWSPVPPEKEGDKSWCRPMRKPDCGMLVSIMHDTRIDKEDVLFVGDMETDEEAAAGAMIDFCYARDFF